MTSKYLDFYNLDDLLTEEEKLVRDTISDFVNEKVLPIIEDCYQQARFPIELVPELAKLGVLGSNISGYECPGLNNVAYGLMMQELERGDSGLRSFVSVQTALVMYPIYKFGTEQQKKKWLPPLARGEKIGCFGLTEPDYGSNPGGMITRAKKIKDGYLLNGSKMWITNGSIADVAVVWAKDDNDIIRGFLVEKGTKGFTAPEIKNKHSLRASITSELVFQDCEIPEENLLPLTEGLKHPLMCLTQARYGIAWGAVGSAIACYSTSLNYSKSRIQFDKPIASFQLVQEKLAFMLTEITKAQLVCLQLGRLKDKEQYNYAQVSLAKRNNVDMALQISRTALSILAAAGITSEYCIMRHMNNLESVRIYEGTHDIHTLILGEYITGQSAFF